MRVKVSEGKTKDVAIIDVTPENYIVPDNEKHLYHCVIEIKKFDSETGKRLSIPRIQKFGKKGYENSIADNLKKQGYTITVLHDPNEYMKAKAEADEKAKAEKAKAAILEDVQGAHDTIIQMRPIIGIHTGTGVQAVIYFGNNR